MTRTWTESEMEYILANYRDMTLTDMGIHLHVAASTVRTKMLEMGIEPVHYRRRERTWTDEEIAFLREHFSHMTAIDIADKLGCSNTTVSTKARELGLTKSPEWSKAMYRGRYVNAYSGRQGFSS